MLFSKKIISSVLITSSILVSGAALAAQDFSHQEISYTDMSHQDLRGANFTGSKINNVDFSHSNLEGAIFKDANLSYLKFGNANLAGASFINSKVAHFSMEDINITNVRFINSELEYLKMNRSNLANVDFRDSVIKHVVMKEACLANALFSNNKLEYVQLDKSVLIGMKLRNNKAKNFTKKNAIYSGVATCAAGVAPRSKTSIKYTQQAIPKPSVRADVINSDDITTALNDATNGRIDLTINFDYDSDRVKGSAHRQILEIAQALQSRGLTNASIKIEGHTDSDGSDNYNMDLSYRRAVSVMSVLTTRYGISTSRFSVQGYGESNPVSSNANDMGKALNRRVTLVNLGTVTSMKNKVYSRKTVVQNKRINVTSNKKEQVSIGNIFKLDSNGKGKENLNMGGDFFNLKNDGKGKESLKIGDFFSLEKDGKGNEKLNIGGFFKLDSNNN